MKHIHIYKVTALYRLDLHDGEDERAIMKEALEGAKRGWFIPEKNPGCEYVAVIPGEDACTS